MEDISRAQARLANIRTVEPILEALRTISVGGWQLALKQQDWLREYGGRLNAVLTALVPNLPGSTYPQPLNSTGIPEQVIALAIGSERGLCGRFSAGIVDAAGDYVRERSASGARVALWALGSRLVQLVRRRGWALAWSGPLSVIALPPVATAWDLSHRWLIEYEEGCLDAVDVIYNAYRGPGVHVPIVVRLLPPELPPVDPEEVWPPPIVATDPRRIFGRVVEQWVALRLYQAMIESAAAEHSARFQLMESATQNTEGLIFELSQFLQLARKQAITTEMQELAVGAGLIGPRSETS